MARWLLLLPLLVAAGAAAQPCPGNGVAVQVLGSGGPEFAARRAGSGYLVWIDGKARLLVDTGPGTALRFAESGASFADLDAILLTNLQAAYTIDLPAYIQGFRFENRDRALPLYGPPAGRGMPSTIGFVRDLFDGTRGTYRHLGEFIAPLEKSRYKLEPHDVREPPPKIGAPRRAAPAIVNVFRNERLQVRAVSAARGTLPALAWRIEAGDRAVVFAGDGDDAALAALADRAGLLVARLTIAEPGGLLPPARLGELAQTARTKRLVLGARARAAPASEDETLAAIRKSYSGPVDFADDLSCYRP